MKLPRRLRQFILVVTMSVVSQAAPAAVPVAEPGGETLLLWPGGTPGAARVTVQEAIVERSPEGAVRDRFVEHVTRPQLTLFAPKGAYNGITLLIVPGGGYVRVVIDKEGFETAQWLCLRGAAVSDAGGRLGRRRRCADTRCDASHSHAAQSSYPGHAGAIASGRDRIFRGWPRGRAVDHRAGAQL
jgi:hypothetical protein